MRQAAHRLFALLLLTGVAGLLPRTAAMARAQDQEADTDAESDAMAARQEYWRERRGPFTPVERERALAAVRRLPQAWLARSSGAR